MKLKQLPNEASLLRDNHASERESIIVYVKKLIFPQADACIRFELSHKSFSELGSLVYISHLVRPIFPGRSQHRSVPGLPRLILMAQPAQTVDLRGLHLQEQMSGRQIHPQTLLTLLLANPTSHRLDLQLERVLGSGLEM